MRLLPFAADPLNARYFPDSGVLGTKEFVFRHYKRFELHVNRV
jgi:hypothetical protein